MSDCTSTGWLVDRISLLGGARRDHCRDLLRPLMLANRETSPCSKVREDVTGTVQPLYLGNLPDRVADTLGAYFVGGRGSPDSVPFRELTRTFRRLARLSESWRECPRAGSGVAGF